MGETRLELPEIVPEEGVEVDLFDKNSLIYFINWANIRLIDTNWLVKAPLHEIAERRQGLPEEAFLSSRMLADKPIVPLSYGWSNPATPDTGDKYARALKRYFGDENSGEPGWPSGRSRYPEGAALFWDHKSLYQNKMKPEWRPDLPGGDWAANLLEGRTVEEEAYFKRALSCMQALYFHAHTDGLIMQDVADGGLNNTEYRQRGWTGMESAGLGLSGRCATIELSGDTSRVSAALPPMTPAAFNKVLATRRFTCSGDASAVEVMYENGFTKYADKAETLYVDVGGFSNPAWKENVTMLAGALPYFKRLQNLSVEGYYTTDHPCREDPKLREAFQLLDAELDALASRGCSVKVGGHPSSLKPWRS